MLLIVLGNGLVVVAIAVDRQLKGLQNILQNMELLQNTAGLQNWFIASLAVSDLLVGLFIMPLSLANELLGYWAFGDILCQLWLSTDVLLCTASILNLVLISLDRYWSVTQALKYIRRRTPRRAALMISAVWILSAIDLQISKNSQILRYSYIRSHVPGSYISIFRIRARQIEKNWPWLSYHCRMVTSD